MENTLIKPLGVKMHPIALLSVVDHHGRSVGNKKNKRAMGVLLGENNKGIYDVTNSYALPFDESHSKDGVWFVDHNYHEAMYQMFQKINFKEKVLGWYVTGSTFKKHDLEINELFAKYTKNPVLIVIDVEGRNPIELPTKAFYSERIVGKNKMLKWQFKNITCSVSAFEPEEVGVEHLVREIKDLNMNSLQNKLNNKVNSLFALEKKVGKIVEYLEDVVSGKKSRDDEIMNILQQIMSKLPKVVNEELKKEMSVKMNDNYLNLYVTNIIKGVVNIHNLLNNRISEVEERTTNKKEDKPKEIENKVN